MAQDGFDAQEYLSEFLTEASDHLATLDDVILEVERLVGDGHDVGDDLVNALFRAIHTLKGMAGMMGFTAFTAIAHDLEQIFDEVRRGDRRLREAEMPVMFDGFDALKRLHGHLAATGGEDGVDLDAVRAAVSALALGGASPAAAPTAEAGGDRPDGLIARLDDHDRMAALVAAAKGEALFELRAEPFSDGGAEGAAGWYEGLSLLGRVLGAWTAAGEPTDGARMAAAAEGEAFDLLLATVADAASVCDCTGTAPTRLREASLPWQRPSEPAAVAAAAPLRAPERPSAAAPGTERTTSIRVETTRLDRLMELVGELVIHQTRLGQISTELSAALDESGPLDARRDRLEHLAAGLDEAMQSVSRVSDELQESTMKVRMVPVRTLFNRFPRIVRDLAHEVGKSARLEMLGGETELDKTVIEQIGDPIIHLVRNAVDHGLEPASERLAAGKPAEGVVTLGAAQQGHHILITVAEDGRGVDRAKVLAKARAQGLVGEHETPSEQDILQLIFRPGFSTAERVTNISGRGVGMDVVLQNIQKLGGSIQVLSEPGVGTRFVVKLPLTLAIAKALLVRAGGHTFAVPLASVEETLRIRPDEIKAIRGQAAVQVRGQVLPLFRLSTLFDLGEPAAEPARMPLVIVGDGNQRLGLLVDALVGQQDVVVKSLGDYLGHLEGVGGATILGDGRVALILDVPTLLSTHGGPAAAERSAATPAR